MNLKDALIYILFGVGTLLLFYFGSAGLIKSTLKDNFPNSQFIIILILMIVVTWCIGLGLRKHRLSIATRSK
ncbi:hypothetical protein [Solibacillus cecembensis]|uniref:hypothetical protein n=1 Tax=Solibacillus cecembensis TaxID=459347 RepID=UPI003CFDF484